VNGGKSWSSWYNQPTAQLYHVSADIHFRTALYSAPTESGSVGIKSRGDQGEITFRDCSRSRQRKYGYVVADPPQSGTSSVAVADAIRPPHRSAQNILPVPVQTEGFRMLRTEPVVFSPLDPHLPLLRGKYALANTRSWAITGKNQSRFVRTELRAGRPALENTKRSNKAGPSTRVIYNRCGVAARREPDLVGPTTV